MVKKYKNNIAEENGKFYGLIKIKGEQRQFLCHGAKTRAEAQAIVDAERFKLRQQQAGLIKKESRITIYKLLDNFLVYSKNNKKSYTTDKSRVKILKQYFSEFIFANKITPRHIEDLKFKLRESGLSTTTINKYLALLSTAYNLKMKELEYNPLSEVKYFKKKHNQLRYLTEEEEVHLLQNLPEYMQDIVHCALYTGLRKENIIGLKWKSIDFKLKKISITENKGNKNIVLPIVKPLEDIFLKLKQYNYSEQYVFANPNTGTRYYEIDRCWRECREKAGLKDFRFHDLSHTVGTRLAKQKVPVHLIQAILAHSDIRTTMGYIHYAEEELKEALSTIL